MRFNSLFDTMYLMYEYIYTQSKVTEYIKIHAVKIKSSKNHNILNPDVFVFKFNVNLTSPSESLNNAFFTIYIRNKKRTENLFDHIFV